MNKENWIAVRKNSLYDNFNLPPQAKAEAEEVFDGMRHLADESHDQAEFEKRIADSPLNMQYSELFTRFAKYVKLPEGTPTQSEIIKGVVSDTAKSSVKSIVVNRARNIFINALPNEVADWFIYRWNNVTVIRKIRSFSNLKNVFRQWFGFKAKK